MVSNHLRALFPISRMPPPAHPSLDSYGGTILVMHVFNTTRLGLTRVTHLNGLALNMSYQQDTCQVSDQKGKIHKHASHLSPKMSTVWSLYRATPSALLSALCRLCLQRCSLSLLCRLCLQRCSLSCAGCAYCAALPPVQVVLTTLLSLSPVQVVLTALLSLLCRLCLQHCSLSPLCRL